MKQSKGAATLKKCKEGERGISNLSENFPLRFALGQK
jgi:hypothetical protein